jgi:hypothetical protein
VKIRPNCVGSVSAKSLLQNPIDGYVIPLYETDLSESVPWLYEVGSDVYGVPPMSRQKMDTFGNDSNLVVSDCKQKCENDPACGAASINKISYICALYPLNGESITLKPAQNESIVLVRLCTTDSRSLTGCLCPDYSITPNQGGYKLSCELCNATDFKLSWLQVCDEYSETLVCTRCCTMRILL